MLRPSVPVAGGQHRREMTNRLPPRIPRARLRRLRALMIPAIPETIMARTLTVLIVAVDAVADVTAGADGVPSETMENLKFPTTMS
jgi:hypothetical protein